MKDVSELFFNQRSFFDLNWQDRLWLRLGPIRPGNKDKISQGLKALSFQSVRNRFMGVKKEFSENELEYLTNLDGWNHYAIGIETRDESSSGVAIARLVRSSTSPLDAEVAITIVDRYQGMGLGNLLLKLILLAAHEREIKRLTFTTLPQNNVLLQLLQKIGTPKVSTVSMDSVTLTLEMMDLNLPKIEAELEIVLPELAKMELR